MNNKLTIKTMVCALTISLLTGCGGDSDKQKDEPTGVSDIPPSLKFSFSPSIANATVVQRDEQLDIDVDVAAMVGQTLEIID